MFIIIQSHCFAYFDFQVQVAELYMSHLESLNDIVKIQYGYNKDYELYRTQMRAFEAKSRQISTELAPKISQLIQKYLTDEKEMLKVLKIIYCQGAIQNSCLFDTRVAEGAAAMARDLTNKQILEAQAYFWKKTHLVIELVDGEIKGLSNLTTQTYLKSGSELLSGLETTRYIDGTRLNNYMTKVLKIVEEVNIVRGAASVDYLNYIFFRIYSSSKTILTDFTFAVKQLDSAIATMEIDGLLNTFKSISEANIKLYRNLVKDSLAKTIFDQLKSPKVWLSKIIKKP